MDDGSEKANARRGFEVPTETFNRRTAMTDRGPPGFEYNSTEHLSVSAVKPGAAGSAVFLASGASRSVGALPGVHVRAYASSPTRDNRAEAADRAAHARAGHAQKTAAKLQQDRRTTMLMSKTAQNEDTSDKSKRTSKKRPPSATTTPIRVPRFGSLAEKNWREALEAKARAIAASPRAGKYARKRGAPRRILGRAAAIKDTGRLFRGVKVPSDAFDTAFARRNELNALPGELESLIFPQRYVDWPKGDAGLPAFASDVQSCAIRHAVAFRSKQPRIVCYDPQRETRGWDGPGAYEWDERPDHTDGTTDGTADGAEGASPTPAPPAATEDGVSGTGKTGGDGGGGKASALKGSRSRGISVRDPERASPVFRVGSSGFMPPCRTNVRLFPEVPVSEHGALVREDEGGNSEEVGGGGGSRSSLANRGQADGTGGRQKEPKKLWMFQQPERVYQPAVATEGWGGPGAYVTESETAMRVRDPGRASPVFRDGSGREGPTRRKRDVSVSPTHPRGDPGTPAGKGECLDTPKLIANLLGSYPEFTHPEPKTIAHNVRNSPVRLGACFLSVTDRFEPVGSESIASPGASAGLGPGAGDTSRGPGGGGGFVGPVERYDLVSARQQPATSATWLGTSIRSGCPYNMSLGTTKAKAKATAKPTTPSTTTKNASGQRPPASGPTPSPNQHLVRGGTGGVGTDVTTDGHDENGAPVDGEPTALQPGDSTKASPGIETGGTTAAAAGPQPPATSGKLLTASSESDAPPRGLLAAEVFANAAAATVAAGLAKNWASCQRHAREGGSGGDVSGRGGSGYGGGGGGQKAAGREQRNASHAVRSSLGDLEPAASLEPETREGAACGVSCGGGGGGERGRTGADHNKVTYAATNTAGVGECRRRGLPIPTTVDAVTGTTAADDDENDATAVEPGFNLRLARDNNRQRRGGHPYKNTLVKKSSSSSFSSGYDTFDVSAKSVGGKKQQRATSIGTNALGVWTKEGLAAVEASMSEEAEAAAAAASAGKGTECSGGLIRTIGRAKRGPCMLTLVASSQNQRRAKEGGKGAGSVKYSGGGGHGGGGGGGSSRVWQTEATGGLLGPGETKLLVC